MSKSFSGVSGSGLLPPRLRSRVRRTASRKRTRPGLRQTLDGQSDSRSVLTGGLQSTPVVRGFRTVGRVRVGTQFDPHNSASNAYRMKLLLPGIAGLFLVAVACDTGPQPPDERAGHFSLSDSAYIVIGTVARLAQDDQRVALGVVMDVAKTDAGYVIADISNDRLVFLDTDLNPVAMAGGTGDGPGEFRGPYRLLTHSDTVVALDLRGRVSYFRPDGGFLRVDRVVDLPLALDFGIHPELGTLFAVSFPDHYLGRVAGDRQERVAEVPAELRSDTAGRLLIHNNQLAVGGTGSIHVLDEKNGVLVNYESDGTGGRITPLPNVVQDRLEASRRTQANLGAVGGQSIHSYHALRDGRLFVGFASDTVVGVVLEMISMKATPVIAQGEWSWLKGVPAKFFDGRHVIFGGGQTVEVIRAETRLLPKSPQS